MLYFCVLNIVPNSFHISSLGVVLFFNGFFSNIVTKHRDEKFKVLFLFLLILLPILFVVSGYLEIIYIKEVLCMVMMYFIARLHCGPMCFLMHSMYMDV
jgi:hypothetical protein